METDDINVSSEKMNEKNGNTFSSYSKKGQKLQKCAVMYVYPQLKLVQI